MELCLALVLAAAAAYFCGCFNGAVIVSKYILHDDVRNHGSGNAGLTNFHRTFGGLLTFVMRNADASHHKTAVLKFIAKAQNVHIVGYAQIAANFVLFNINCADYNYNFCAVCKLHKHSKLAVRLKTRKYSGCMKIIKEFSAEFKIQLSAELTDTFFYVFRLNF